MSGTDRESGGLDAAVKAALATTEPAATPPFDHVWTRARASRRRTRAAWPHPAAVAASVVAAAAVAWLAWPTGPTPEDDYQLARQLVALHSLGTPTDRWLTGAPQTPLTGLPGLPATGLPTIPEENLL